MLTSIIHNLVSNAIKYSGKGGTISISSEIKDDKIIEQVQNSGIVMSKDFLDKLFTPQMKNLLKKNEEKMKEPELNYYK